LLAGIKISSSIAWRSIENINIGGGGGIAGVSAEAAIAGEIAWQRSISVAAALWRAGGKRVAAASASSDIGYGAAAYRVSAA